MFCKNTNSIVLNIFFLSADFEILALVFIMNIIKRSVHTDLGQTYRVDLLRFLPTRNFSYYKVINSFLCVCTRVFYSEKPDSEIRLIRHLNNVVCNKLYDTWSGHDDVNTRILLSITNYSNLWKTIQTVTVTFIVFCSVHGKRFVDAFLFLIIKFAECNNKRLKQ